MSPNPQELQKRIEEAKRLLLDLEWEVKNQSSKSKTDYENGKIYKIINGGIGCLIANGSTGRAIPKPETAPVNYSGQYWDTAEGPFIMTPNGDVFGLCEGHNLEEIDIERWKTMLINEAIKRGFDKGVTVKTGTAICNKVGSDDSVVALSHARSYYDADRDELDFGGWCIYHSGDWAKVLKKETIVIAGKELTYKNGMVHVNGTGYTEREIRTLSSIMEAGQVKSLNVDCNGRHLIDLALINKILKGFKTN